MKMIIFTIVLTIFTACNSSKEAAATAETLQKSADTINTFTVSFISIGAGTDRAARDQYNQLIAEFAKSNNINLPYEEIPWGREGEVDYCFNFNKIEKQKAAFIKESKELLKTSSLINFEENVACKQKMD